MFDIYLFTEAQGNFLIRLLIAHCIADFLLQTKKMVANKKWFSKAMALHIAIVAIMTFILTQNFVITLIVSVIHYVIDGLKIELLKTKKYSQTLLFVTDQILHIVSLVTIWSIYFCIIDATIQAVLLPINNYKISLLFLGYILVTTPFGYLIGHITKKMHKTKEETHKNGLYIGIFERIIILTFMLLAEYSAIGFLITGKSIIRFSAKNEDLKSEYVLLGTMISYGVTIICGIIIRKLIY